MPIFVKSHRRGKSLVKGHSRISKTRLQKAFEHHHSLILGMDTNSYPGLRNASRRHAKARDAVHRVAARQGIKLQYSYDSRKLQVNKRKQKRTYALINRRGQMNYGRTTTGVPAGFKPHNT